MQVFSTQLCDLYSPLLSLSPLLYGSTLPPSPLPCVNKCAVQTFTLCKGGVWGSVGDHILHRSFTLCI
jgi:hypothetical protein